MRTARTPGHARDRRRWGALTAAAALGIAAITGGCAERRLVAQPPDRPSSATWMVVWFAGALLAAVVGVLLTLPSWRSRGGSRLAVLVLTAQTGAVAVGGTLLAAVAIRSGQLVNRPVDAASAAALVRLSSVDGDTGFFSLMAVAVAGGATLVVTLTALATRFAASATPSDRWIASALLGVEVGGCAYAIVRLALGAHGLPYLVPALATPLLTVAWVRCWPRIATDPIRTAIGSAPASETGYNEGHG